MNRRAFTLVELLVTIAIIVLLLALLFPGLAAARKSSRLTAGAANLRSCGQVMLSYTNDHKGDFLNPFRPSWPADFGNGELTWYDIVSPTDKTMFWSMWANDCYPTDSFMFVWYSYLSTYRGGGRISAEMFSPADPSSYAISKDFEQHADDQDRFLVAGSFCYSPAFWTKAGEVFSGSLGASLMRTANINGVLHPTKKAMVWEYSDCRPREPVFHADVAASPLVMMVDGSVLNQPIADIVPRLPQSNMSMPTKFAMVRWFEFLECNPPQPQQPVNPETVHCGFFAFTGGGILGQDVP